MREVRIDKIELRKRVEKNRDGHRAEYDAAMKAYRQVVKDWFAEQGERVANGEHFVTSFAKPEPEDHTADYDAVLDMLDMSEDDTITLTAAEFKNYVRDEWGWQEFTKANFASYTSQAQ